jgi:hypothetical protein
MIYSNSLPTTYLSVFGFPFVSSFSKHSIWINVYVVYNLCTTEKIIVLYMKRCSFAGGWSLSNDVQN